MSTDNRTEINACNANTGFVGDGSHATNTTVGQRYEGSGSVETQHTNSDEHLYATQDTSGTGLNLDLSDATVYLMVKDNLVDTFANGGVQVVLGDTSGPDRIGYDVGGNDAPGFPLAPFYTGFKLDCTNRPAAFAVYAGTEANLTLTAISRVGYGSLHLAKAQGNVPNVFLDRMTYMANGSYALTINGGTSGTPETMADVKGDDVTNGWGMINNPLGSQYGFFAPTEWGTPSGTANSYFTADGEQWFWIGDNSGGQAVGATHFPFRIIGNATGTNSWVVNNTVIVNTGTRAELLLDDANMDTVEMDGCSFTGLGTIGLPSSGGTSRFTTNCIFSNCDQITNNGADMTGSSVLLSNVAADEGALFYDENADPDGELDGLTFSQGTNAHHAIRFGTNVPATMTLRDCSFSGFSSSDDNNGSVFRFDDTSGSITLNLVNCSHDGSGFTVDDAAGVTVTVVIDPATTKFTVEDVNGNPIENARVLAETADAGDANGFPFEDSVTTLTQSAGTATLTASAVHGLATGDYVVVRGAQPDGYNKVAQITVTSTTVFTYTVPSGLSSPATGTPVFSYAPIGGVLTNASGVVSSSKTWSSSTAQGIKGWARKKNTSTPFYQDADINISDARNGTDITLTLQPDE